MDAKTAELNPELLARILPDEPAWVDLRGTLLSGRCRVFSEENARYGFVVRSLDHPFAAAVFEPRVEQVQWAFAVDNPWPQKLRLLVPKRKEDYWSRRLPGWQRVDVVLHRLGEGSEPSAVPVPAGVEIRRVEPDVDLSHLPDEIRDEYVQAVEDGRPMTAAFVDGLPVAFCYAALETEGLWDVAIDTLEAHRRKGLAAAAFWELHRWMSAEKGKAPVWGAYADNPASLALAAKLGFEEDSRLVALRP